MRLIAANDLYVGQSGYPQIVKPDLVQKVRERIKRTDPAARHRQKGGRPPADESYLLRGFAFCVCGAPLYQRRMRGRRRAYICAVHLQATGMCDQLPIDAKLAESHVLRHLEWFIGSVEEWIGSKVQARDIEEQSRLVALDRERAVLVRLDQQREKLMVEYERQVADDHPLARYGLEAVERKDREREEQQHAIRDVESVLSEWTGSPD